MQPDTFDQLDPDEAQDLVERIEKMQLERDKLMMGFLAKLFEHTTFILGTGLGLKLRKPKEEGEHENERGEVDWYAGKGGASEEGKGVVNLG